MRATRFLWAAAGRPWPTETDGTPLQRATDLAGGRCASCGEPSSFALSQAISDNFTTLRNDGRAWPHGGLEVCQACTWACRSLALRCAPFFATPTGWQFLRSRPDPADAGLLAALLDPPAPPFVACFPRFGVEHGGEENLDRTRLSYDGVDLVLWAKLRAAAAPAMLMLEEAAPPSVKTIHVKRQAALGVVTLTPPWPSGVDWRALAALLGPH
jgi:hypothetical protein